MSIATIYDPTSVEDSWYSYWESQGFFRSTPDHRTPYTIVIPPPNVTGILHMGHMLNNTIQDVLVRRKRMQGYNALWVPGTDHASIATEAKVVKMLRDMGIQKSSLTRDEFLRYAFEWKEKYGGIILKQLRKLGASCDWERTHFTMDKDYYDAVIKVFIDLYEKGLIYRGERIVNWDPVALTAVSDEEVMHVDMNDQLYFVKYPVENSDEFVTIATTRPETIMADTAVSVHPDDPRFRHLIGKHVIVPFVNRRVPVIADTYVDMEFGTGCLKVTPAHDVNDFGIGERHGLEVISILNPNGTLNEHAQVFVGMDRFVARKAAAKELKEMGLLVKTEQLFHKVGTSERTGAVIEPLMSMQWWLSMKKLSMPAYKAVMEDTVKLIPDKFKSTYRHWMENIKDWCISRQLWWGHRIPAWYAPDGRMAVALTAEEACAKLNKNAPDLSGPAQAMDRGNITHEEFQALEDQWIKPGQLRQDEDVLDTWFSSWLWPMEVFKGISDPGNEEFKYYYPTNDLVTAPEILFFWVARMIISGYEYTGEKPFSNVYLTGIVRDGEGRKMSKQFGNSPDPEDLFKLYSTDGVRIGILMPSPAGNDLKFDTPLKITEETPLISKYCETGRNFCNKMWNACRLVKGWDVEHNLVPRTTDIMAISWMEARLEQVKVELDSLFDSFRMSEALTTVYRLIWDDFCSLFLEMVKPPYEGKMSGETYQQVLRFFDVVLQLAHPFTPFITEELWHLLRNRPQEDCIMISQLDPADKSLATSPLLDEMALITEVITALRNLRSRKGLSPHTPLTLIVKTSQPEAFTKYQPMLTRMSNISELSFTDQAVAGAMGALVRTHELYVPMAGGINTEEEAKRINKEIERNENLLAGVMKKLSNEKFVSNAAQAVIDNERKKKADAETNLAMLRDSLKALNN